MADDVVAELDRWLDNSNDRTTAIERRVVLRVRDEIVALRQAMTHDSAAIATLCNHARKEALEEAASIAQKKRTVEGRETAIAIRKLKGSPLAGSAASGGSHG